MRPSRPPPGWIVATVAVLFAAAAVAGPGRRGSVKIKLLGGDPPARSLRYVVILSADSGEVLDSMSVGRRRQLVLRPSPGVLFTAATDVSVRTVRSGVSRVFLVDPAVASSIAVRPRRLAAPQDAATPARVPATGVAAAAGSSPGGPVVTMGSIPVTIQGTNQTGSLGAALVTGAFAETHDAGARWVSTDPKVVEARQHELDLQAQGRLDPSTPIRDDPLVPNTRVEGELALADGRLTGELRIVDLRTGEVIDRIPVDRDFDRDSLDDLRKLLGDLSDAIIRAILESLSSTTTTSTTSTTTTTSTTSTTTTTTTVVTTTTTTTTTTIPTTTTTSSTTTTTLVSCGSGLLDSADVFHDVRASAQASSQAMGSKQDAYHPGLATVPLGEAGGTDTKQYSLAAASGAMAVSTGAVTWNVSPCQITASGTFHEASTSATETSAASTGLDARLQITFRVKRFAPYTLTGQVRAMGHASTAPASSAYLRCSSHFGTADANLQNPGGAVPFHEESALFPDEELTILCAVIRGGSSTVPFGDDQADLAWSYTVTLGN